MTEIRN